MPVTLGLSWSQPPLCPQGTKKGPNATSRMSAQVPSPAKPARLLAAPPVPLAPSRNGAVPPGSTFSQPLGPRPPCAGIHRPPSPPGGSRWAPPQVWFPGQCASARLLKCLPVAGLCLHVRRGPRLWGRSPKAGKLLEPSVSVWKSPHLLLKLLRLEKGEREKKN